MPGLWGSDVKATLYAKQVWPKARVLVWAKPGSGAKDGWDAKHWLEDGKPAAKGIDVDSDLVLPDSGNGYSVSLTDGRKYQPSAFRHLTIGAQACVVGHFSVKGNVWIKAGGKVMFLDSAVGGGHTFWRNDNLSNGWDARGLSLVDHFQSRSSQTARPNSSASITRRITGSSIAACSSSRRAAKSAWATARRQKSTRTPPSRS